MTTRKGSQVPPNIQLVNRLRESAQIALTSGHPKKARRLLEQALSLSPDLSHLHLLLSQALAALGNRDAALSHAELAVKLQPPDPLQAAVWKARLLACSGQRNGAGGVINNVSSVQDNPPFLPGMFLPEKHGGCAIPDSRALTPGTAKFQQAMRFRHSGKTGSMKRLLRSYAGNTPQPGMPLFIALMETHRYTEAFQLAEKLKSRHDGDIFTLRSPFDDISPRLGQAYFRGHAEKLSRLRLPRGLEYWKFLYLGLAHSLISDHNAALECFAKLETRCGMADGWMLFEKARLLLNAKNDLPAARKYFRKTLAATAGDWTAACYLAEIDVCSGRKRLGFKRFREELAKAANHNTRVNVLAWRGEMRLLCGQYGLAVRDLEAALAGGSAFACCWLGAALFLRGKTGPALEKLGQAVRTMPQDREAAVWYGEALRSAGRTKEARRVLRGEHNSDWGAVNLMILECDAGNESAAKEYFLRLGGNRRAASLPAIRAAGLRLLRSAKGHRSSRAHQGISVRALTRDRKSPTTTSTATASRKPGCPGKVHEFRRQRA